MFEVIYIDFIIKELIKYCLFKFTFLIKVLEVSWKDLNEKLNEAKDMDDVIAANENFLDKIISQLLLDQKSIVFYFFLSFIYQIILLT